MIERKAELEEEEIARKAKDQTGGRVMGTIIGLAAGAWVSYSFVLPTDVLSLKLAEITIGDILRILASFVIFLAGGGIGALMDALIEERKGAK